MKNILYLQKRPNKGGAQHSLSRVLAHEKIRALHPFLVTSGEGWLTRRCRELGVRHLERDFPSPRSLGARLFQNRQFAVRLATILAKEGASPMIVHGNDHHESLLTLAVAGALGSRSALFLRSPGMTRRDYVKHHCRKADLLIAVGDELAERVRRWDPHREVVLVYNGVYPEEILPPKALKGGFPDRVLVVGSHLDWKGWSDVVGALHLLDREMSLPPVEIHFTGREPTPAENDLGLGRLPGVTFRFLGHTEDFRGLLRSYDLVINPSWMESFGMAAVEALAAGVPLLSSRTGVIERIQKREELLFDPGDPEDLARALKNVILNWREVDFNLPECQREIRENFTTDQTVEKLVAQYQRLVDG